MDPFVEAAVKGRDRLMTTWEPLREKNQGRVTLNSAACTGWQGAALALAHITSEFFELHEAAAHFVMEVGVSGGVEGTGGEYARVRNYMMEG